MLTVALMCAMITLFQWYATIVEREVEMAGYRIMERLLGVPVIGKFIAMTAALSLLIIAPLIIISIPLIIFSVMIWITMSVTALFLIGCVTPRITNDLLEWVALRLIAHASRFELKL